MPRSGSVRANASYTCAYVYERNAHRSAPTTHRNREYPGIFLALASSTVLSVMDGRKNAIQLRLRPSQDEKPIFYHEFLS